MAIKGSWFKLDEQEWIRSIAIAVSLSVLAGSCYLAFFWHLGDIGLIDETEPLFAEAARQMLETGDWITPYFNGATRFDKPPLIYWLMAIAYRAFGVNEWAARLPSALSATLLTGMVFLALCQIGEPETEKRSPDLSSQLGASLESLDGQRLGEIGAIEIGGTLFRNRSGRSWRVASLGAFLTAFNIETLVWARIGVSDMLLSACIGGALICFFLGYVEVDRAVEGSLPAGHPNSKPIARSPFPRGWYLGFYLLLALGVLAKGPVAIALPGFIVVSFAIYIGKWREIARELHLISGTLVFLAIASPWFLAVTQQHGSTYLETFFGYHNVQRFTQVVNDHSAPWYFYILVILVGFAPWSVHLPRAIARLNVWQRRYWLRQPRANHLGVFACFWFLCIFVFFTISVTKLPSYVLPLMPAAAILVALSWQNIASDRHPKKCWGILAGEVANILLAIALSATLFISPHLLGRDPAAPNLQELLSQSQIPAIGGSIWAIVAAISLVLLFRQRGWIGLRAANLIGFLAFYIFVLTPAYFLMDEARQMPLRELAAIRQQIERPGETSIAIGLEKPTLVFYSQRPVRFFRLRSSALDYFEEELEADSMLAIGHPEKLDRLTERAREADILAERGTYQLVRLYK